MHFVGAKTYFLANFITKTGEPGTSVWTCRKKKNKVSIPSSCIYYNFTNNSLLEYLSSLTHGYNDLLKSKPV